ncbi:hypothetical protein [Sphingobium sp.]|uniref:hypothetical protein n=1 Tax=Sphingobium sp. TaxID=1912891 RepID=UPI0035C7049E
MNRITDSLWVRKTLWLAAGPVKTDDVSQSVQNAAALRIVDILHRFFPINIGGNTILALSPEIVRFSRW